ncbi:uncharacterized protein EDB91DRAFT_402339 [Suillus paluster]|uniref:uncharacterized protein n=1 Tax=Suillus paluster TaxID=48578 RepID=UPI001B87F579|nr:uncharacterized protein EDB91DRAFT_402339 [Suillus paluster]KAG1753531.1 hypothetical protein EDB91DRAFT_402339 [Suillus paluster]
MCHLESPSHVRFKSLKQAFRILSRSVAMPVDPLQLLSLLAFLSALEARGVSLTTGLTNMIISLPFNRMSNSSSCGLSNTSAATSSTRFFDHRELIQDPSTPESDYPPGFDETPSTSFPLLYRLLLIFSGQFVSISRDISSLRRSVASLGSSLSAVEDRIALLANTHESTLAQLKDEPYHIRTQASCDTEELGQQLHHLSGLITAQQDQMSALHDMVGALQACTVHVNTDHQLRAEHTRSYKDPIQHHTECKKDCAALRQDLQKLSDLVSINDTKTNVSLDHLRSQMVDQVKDQNRTEKEVALLREQMTKKFGAFQSRVSSLTLDAVKVPHGVQLTDQAAKEARRAKAMAGVGRRIMQLQANPQCVLDNEDIVSQNDENGAEFSSVCHISSLSSAASLRPSVECFQDSDVLKASSPCVQWVGTIAPSNTKVLSNLRSPLPSQQYANCKDNLNVDDIHSPSTSAAFCQDDVEASVLRRKQKKPALTPFQPKGAFPPRYTFRSSDGRFLSCLK